MWWFVSPRIVFGEDALDYLEEVKARKAVIVTDQGIRKVGFVERITSYLGKNATEVETFEAVEPDPSKGTVFKCVELLKRFEPELIIGLGGGSPIDVAKAAWLLYENPGLSLEEVTPFAELTTGKKARLITIPTTSGGGAELSWAMVVTDKAEQRKLEPATREVIADICILDPSLVSRMPPQLTADTGLDALANCIESYVCEWRNDFTDALAIKAMSLIFEYLPEVYKKGDDMIARERMQNAAAMAGLAFGNSQVTIAHSMGHALGSIFHVSHGRSVEVVLPYVIQYTKTVAADRYAELAAAIGIKAKSSEEATDRLVVAVKELIKQLNEPLSIKEIGISDKDFREKLDLLVERAELDTCTITSPRAPSEDEFRKLFLHAYEGRDVDF